MADENADELPATLTIDEAYRAAFFERAEPERSAEELEAPRGEGGGWPRPLRQPECRPARSADTARA